MDFTLSVVRGDGQEEVVMERLLQPLTRPADGGTHEFTVQLPADPDLRVIIRTAPGPAGDGQWDWSYLGALTFSR